MFFLNKPMYLHVTPSGHNLNKLAICQLGDATYRMSRLEVIEKKIFHVFTILAYVKHVTPRAGLFLAPGA